MKILKQILLRRQTAPSLQTPGSWFEVMRFISHRHFEPRFAGEVPEMEIRSGLFSTIHKLALLLLLPLTGFSQNFITNTGIGIVNSGTMTTNGVWSNASGSTLNNTGSITTTAVFTSAAGSTITNNGSFATSESWTNNGTLAGTGKFILNYATNKSFVAGGTEIGLLRKNGAGVALINGNLNISDSLNIKGGIVKLTNATDVLWAKNKVGVASGSYIDGAFAQAGGGDKVFPLGRDGRYLPITLTGLNSTKTTARVLPALPGIVAGSAVESLVDFPYVWQVDENTVADTATAVQVSYPGTLPVPANAIVARLVDGVRYNSMGVSSFTNAGGVVTVRSFSPRLKGIYTIVNGYPSNPAADRQALIDLYNNTNGSGWANKTNWLTEASIDQWFGVSVTANTITEVNLPANNLVGSVPRSLTGIVSLQKFDVRGNAINAIPDFSANETFNYLDVSNNKLEFSTLEPNRGLLNPPRTFNYLGQADIGEEKTENVPVNTSYSITAPTSGSNLYAWKYNGNLVETSTANPYTIASIGRSNMGVYSAEITNSNIPGLTLKMKPVTALAVADLKGKLFAKVAQAADQGTMTLYRVRPGKDYEILTPKQINTDGTYSLDQVIVGDYLLEGVVDPVKYAKSLPTWFGNTIYWEQSGVISVDSDLTGLNIISEYLPTGPPTGNGVISGFILDDGEEGGRMQSPKRLSGAGTSVRKVQQSGRGQGEKTALVAYVLSDENGEYTFENLESGDYRLNIQYPGYPMDTTSFVKMTIGTGIKSEVRSFAEVKGGKVKVNMLKITNIYEKEDYVADAFPNPTNTQLNIKFSIPSQQRLVTLTDVMGREVMQESAPGLSWQANVQHLAEGVYILKVTDKNEVVKTVRVIKE